MALTYDYIHLTCGSVDLDLASATAAATGNAVMQWEPQPPQLRQTKHTTAFKHGTDLRSQNYDNVVETFTLTIFGSSQDDFMNQVQTLYKLQELAKENMQRPPNVKANPVYLIYQPRNATNQSRSEVYRIDIKPHKGSWTGPDLIANRSSFDVAVEREPFWGSTGAISPNISTASTTGNGNAVVDFTNVLGAVFCPMIFVAQATGGNSANADTIIAGLRRYYTPTNFVSSYSASQAQLFNDAASLTSTDFWSNGTNKGLRVTPTSKAGGNGKLIARWLISANVQDQYGSFHVFARCRDNNGTAVAFKIKMRSGLTISGAGGVSKIAVTAGGTGYTSAPSVTIAAPGGTGVTATAVAKVSGGAVTEIIITNQGSGYTTLNPSVSFGGPGTGATATATTYTDLFGDFTTNSANAAGGIGGTTEFYMIDLGRVDLPGVNTNGVAVNNLVLELWGDSTLGSLWTTFDFDYLQLIPIGESDNDTGVVKATFPLAVGSTNQFTLNTKANVGPVPAFLALQSNGSLVFTPNTWQGRGIYYFPGVTNRLVLLIMRSDGRHDYTTTISGMSSTYLWRGLFPRGTT